MDATAHGTDADVADGGLDDASDAALAADAADSPEPSDSGLDGSAPDDPGWTRLPRYGTECWCERASRPESVLALHWEPCADGLLGCEMAVVDHSIGVVDGARPLAGGNDGRGVVQWELTTTGPVADVVVASRDDVVVAAFRQISTNPHVYCGPALAGSVDALANDNFYGPEPARSRDHVSMAEWSDLGPLYDVGWSAPDAVTPVGTYLEAPSVSATTYAAVALNGDVVAVELTRGAVIGHAGDGPVVVGHVVLWDWSAGTFPSSIHVAGLDLAEATLYTPPVGQHVFGVRSDGTTIAFLEGADDPAGTSFPLNELWAAPFRSSAPLDAHLVRDDLVRNSPAAAVGEGMYAYVGGVSSGPEWQVCAVDLASAIRRCITLPFDSVSGGVRWRALNGVAWVSRTQLAFPASREEGRATMQTLLRIDLSTLSPEVAP